MNRRLVAVVALAVVSLFLPRPSSAQKLSVKWEELTAGDFVKGIQQSKGVCLLPFGIIEKHGPHLPLGTDLLDVRYGTEHAAEQEYAVIFPAYYFGQIFEARHEPGTVAYSSEIQLKLLQETTDEMARNGCKKIIIVNGHGGNSSLLPYFGQTQMAREHDYVVYVLDVGSPKASSPGPAKKSKGVDYHAGEDESSNILYTHPELAHIDRASSESGGDQQRITLPSELYTGIWWYARFPEHYSGDGSVATRELGEWNVKNWIEEIVNCIKAVKADDNSLRIQNEFYEKSKHPLDTKQ